MYYMHNPYRYIGGGGVKGQVGRSKNELLLPMNVIYIQGAGFPSLATRLFFYMTLGGVRAPCSLSVNRARKCGC